MRDLFHGETDFGCLGADVVPAPDPSAVQQAAAAVELRQATAATGHQMIELSEIIEEGVRISSKEQLHTVGI